MIKINFLILLGCYRYSWLSSRRKKWTRF